MGTQLGKEDLLRWQAAVVAHGEGDAEAAYNNLCDMEEQPAPIVFNLAMMHCSAGNFAIALTMLAEAITKNKHLVVARFHRALVSHRLEKNEDAMMDLQACIDIMHEADFINYNTLGLEYVFCRHYAQYNLAVIRLVLGLKEMAADMYRQALVTQARMRADATVMDLAKEHVEIILPELTSFTVDPCAMSHEHGECPMLRLPAMLIFKPAGLGKDILQTTVGEKKDFLGRKQAKVLFSKEASGLAYAPGFRGRLHVEEFMPMAISTSKQRKQRKKKPGSALSGLIKSATPRIMMVKPTPSSTSGVQPRSTSLPVIEADVIVDRHMRSKSLFVPPPEEPEDEVDASPAASAPPPATAMARDDIDVDVPSPQSPPSSPPRGAQQHWDKEGRMRELENTAFLGMKKTSIGLAKSIEVLYGAEGTASVTHATAHAAHAVAHADADADADATPSDDSDTAASSSSRGGGDGDAGYDSRTHINVSTPMTPTTLRDLADLLEHLQRVDTERRFVVNVHMHQQRAAAL